MVIALLFVFFAVGIFGIYLLVLWYSRYMYKTLVTDKLSAIDEVMETGEVPAKWKRRFLLNLINRAEGTFFYSIGGFVLKKLYTRKLIGLIDYIQHSTHLRKDERDTYVIELEDILEDWNSRNIKQLL